MNEPVLISEKYMLVIDTDSNCSEFGSALCAYCTGFDDENASVGYADLFYLEMDIDDDGEEMAIEKNPFNGYILEEEMADGTSAWSYWLNRNWGIDEKGNAARITPENYGNYIHPAPYSLAIFFDIEPTEQQVQIVKERATKFFAEMWPKAKENEQKKMTKIEGFRLIKHAKYGEEKTL